MLNSPDPNALADLDACIDALIAGQPWETLLPADDAKRGEVLEVMAVAQRLLSLAKATPSPEPASKRRIWRHASARFSVLKAIALYRLPFLPPLWIRPEAC